MINDILIQNVNKKVAVGFYIRGEIELVVLGKLRYISEERYGVMSEHFPACEVRFDFTDVKTLTTIDNVLSIYLN